MIGGKAGKTFSALGYNQGIKYLSVAAAGKTNTSLSVTKPAGVAKDDLLIAFLNSNSAISNPAGWNLVISNQAWNGTSGYSKVYTKIATVSEPASYLFVSNNGIIIAYRYTSLWSAGSFTKVAAGVANLALTRINGGKLLAFYAANSTGGGRTFTPNTGTERFDNCNTGRYSHGVTELAISNISITRSNTSSLFGGVLIAIT